MYRILGVIDFWVVERGQFKKKYISRKIKYYIIKVFNSFQTPFAKKVEAKGHFYKSPYMLNGYQSGFVFVQKWLETAFSGSCWYDNVKAILSLPAPTLPKAFF